MEKIRVELKRDLTDYNPKCKVGETGDALLNATAMKSMGIGNFVVVEFDNGAVLDVLWKSLEPTTKKK